MSAAPTGNLLAAETSPYLLQHKDNPVAWRPWGPQALAEAKAQNKPVLLSIGYAACHWCHVMAEESFADAETAAQMNANFIPVKVDREERPDVDALYQSALTLMGQQSGWPATVFLTPDGDAYFGGTYFPKTDNGRGQPPFTQLLTDMARVFTEEPEKVAQNARVIREQLELMWPKQVGAPVNPNAMEPVSRRVTQRLDLFFGGFEGAPKFPQTPALHLVWRAFMRSAAPQFGNAVVLTLDNMCQGGIYDHLGGGFARYSTDERWLVPHFEKMLYDNALIVELMTLAWQHTRSPLYAARIDETIDWLLREMVTKDGAFAASLDADSEGVEGKYYVWTEAEIDAALGEGEAPLFKQVYSVTKDGNFNGKSILHRLGVPGFLRPDQEAVLTRHRRMLLLERAKRVRPNLDDKVLSDWNGLAVAALAQAGAVFRRPEWHFAAVRAFWAIDEKMTDGKILYHTYRDGKRQHEATAEGYAYMARAALILFELSNDPRYLDRARSWMARLDTAFRDRTSGGYFFSSAEQNDVPIRQKTAYDSATPNHHGVILEVLGRLRVLTGEGAYGESIEAIGNFFGGEVARNPTALNTFFTGLEYALAAVQIVIIGDDQQADTQSLVRAVLERSIPCRLLTVLRPGAKLPAGHPAQGKGQEGGKATAYVCQGGNCSPPVTDPNQLANGLLTEPFQRIMRQQAEAQAQVQQPQAANRR